MTIFPTPHPRLLELQLPQCPEALVVTLSDYISQDVLRARPPSWSPPSPTSTELQLPQCSATELQSRTAPRRLCWVGPASRGAGGVRRTQGSLQRFYPSRRRHGSREGPAEGCRGRRAERHVSRPGVAPLIETLPGPPSPSSLGSQESRPPDTRVWASGLLFEGCGVWALSPLPLASKSLAPLPPRTPESGPP